MTHLFRPLVTASALHACPAVQALDTLASTCYDDAGPDHDPGLCGNFEKNPKKTSFWGPFHPQIPDGFLTDYSRITQRISIAHARGVTYSIRTRSPLLIGC